MYKKIRENKKTFHNTAWFLPVVMIFIQRRAFVILELCLCLSSAVLNQMSVILKRRAFRSVRGRRAWPAPGPPSESRARRVEPGECEGGRGRAGAGGRGQNHKRHSGSPEARDPIRAGEEPKSLNQEREFANERNDKDFEGVLLFMKEEEEKMLLFKC